mgnify:CR=1 FL=1
MPYLTDAQIRHYRDAGFVVVENVVPPGLLERARAAVDEFVTRSRGVTAHTDIFDLEPGHSPEAPRLRRIKNPVQHHPVFAEILRLDSVLDPVEQLVGPGIRLHGSKLNMKAAEFGSPVEWHQDLPFYPHTNDDLLAVGIALDECTLENGCMLMVPGSHRGPMLDHHQDGVFAGAIDPEAHAETIARAVPVPVPAGGMSIHHCLTLHGSAPNTSSRPRRLLLFEFAALDAWPLMGVPDLAAFDAEIVRGEPVSEYRLKAGFTRIPLPKSERQGSIYEIQTILRGERRAFARST